MWKPRELQWCNHQPHRWKSKHFSLSKFILGNCVENCQAFLWSKDSWVGIRSAVNNNLCDLHAWNKVRQRKVQIDSACATSFHTFSCCFITFSVFTHSNTQLLNGTILDNEPQLHTVQLHWSIQKSSCMLTVPMLTICT